jgi:hypothetical protein
MEYHIIRQIVKEMFDKAMKSCPSDAHTTLSNHIEVISEPRISYRTAARAYKKYIEEEEMDWSPNRVSIENFCKYLDCEGFSDYVEKNITEIKKNPVNKGPIPEISNLIPATKEENDGGAKTGKEKSKKNRKWVFIMTIVLSSIIIFLSYNYRNESKNKTENKEPLIDCMVWAKNHYEKIDCNLLVHPKYGTKVEPFLPFKSTMKKIEVSASTKFFSEINGKPLIWYYKTKQGALEYFNLPGLHPINGETLRKITEGMIEKYVPVHRTEPDSFVSENTFDFIKADIAILVLNGNDFDNLLASSLKTNYFSKKKSIIRLKDLARYDKNYISNFNPSEKFFFNNKTIKVDTLVLGISKYTFYNDRNDMIICNLQFDFTLHNHSSNNWKEVVAQTITSIGSGYSKSEAKNNAIKKIIYE